MAAYKSVVCKLCARSLFQRFVSVLPPLSIISRQNSQHNSLVSTSLPDVESEIEKVSRHSLRGKAMRTMQARLAKREPLPSSREIRMKEDQDWTSIYPTAAPFKWSAVPLPIRMGFPVKRGVPPHKYGNAELLKIPNFLHLTPPAIKKHCAALKEFCTDWPTGLENDKDCEKHFPVEIETSDYVFSGASLRQPDARIVKLRIKLKDLPLDKHARWKLIQLAGKRYDKETQTVTITTDRCPVRQQNYDYAMYLLTVLLHEAWITEPWEEDITEEDMEEYVWDTNASRRSVITTLARMKDQNNMNGEVSPAEELEYLKSPEVAEYRDAVTSLRNTGEEKDSLDRYKAAALKLLQLDKVEELDGS